MNSTASTITPDFFREAVASGVGHSELEMYTFDVLPRELRGLRRSSHTAI